jgi:hypothetical protein
LGDNWEHVITLEGRSEASDHVGCTDGRGHGVAEDVGNVKGWEDLLKAYRTATPTREQMERREWFEHQASNCDPLGLGNGRDKVWDKEKINRQLALAGL